jgi:electron transport complex protein RnfG
MNTPAPPVQAPPSGSMIRALGGVAMISGFLVVLVFQITLPMIEENQRLAIEQAIFQVIPGATRRVDFSLGPGGLTRVDEATPGGAEDTQVYAGYDASGKLLGVALEAAAQGYQDVIRLLYGYSPEREHITGIKVLKMTETPGLGDKIASDPAFLANFKALDARLNADKTALLNPIETVKHGRKTDPWQIDAISGATISSRAVGKMLNESAQTYFPRLSHYIDELHIQ